MGTTVKTRRKQRAAFYVLYLMTGYMALHQSFQTFVFLTLGVGFGIWFVFLKTAEIIATAEKISSWESEDLIDE